MSNKDQNRRLFTHVVRQLDQFKQAGEVGQKAYNTYYQEAVRYYQAGQVDDLQALSLVLE